MWQLDVQGWVFQVKVIIAGGRHLTNRALVEAAVAASGFLITEEVCGGADGIDEIGRQIAVEKGVPVKMFPADWNKHGRAAGPIRNGQMAEYADALIAIPDSIRGSPGTHNMIDVMRMLKKPVYVHRI